MIDQAEVVESFYKGLEVQRAPKINASNWKKLDYPNFDFDIFYYKVIEPSLELDGVYETRTGKKYKVLAIRPDAKYPVLAYPVDVSDPEWDFEDLRVYAMNGAYILGSESPEDLIL